MVMLRSPEDSIQLGGALMILWRWLIGVVTGRDQTSEIAAIREHVYAAIKRQRAVRDGYERRRKKR